MTSLIMSSCCTLRLKRRSAFSRDSPSCSRTSAKPIHPQTRPVGPSSYCKVLTLSQEVLCTIPQQKRANTEPKLILRREPRFSPKSAPNSLLLCKNLQCPSKNQFHRQLNLPWRIRGIRFHKVIWQFVICRIGCHSGSHGTLHKRAGIHH